MFSQELQFNPLVALEPLSFQEDVCGCVLSILRQVIYLCPYKWIKMLFLPHHQCQITHAHEFEMHLKSNQTADFQPDVIFLR